MFLFKKSFFICIHKLWNADLPLCQSQDRFLGWVEVCSQKGTIFRAAAQRAHGRETTTSLVPTGHFLPADAVRRKMPRGTGSRRKPEVAGRLPLRGETPLAPPGLLAAEEVKGQPCELNNMKQSARPWRLLPVGQRPAPTSGRCCRQPGYSARSLATRRL